MKSDGDQDGLSSSAAVESQRVPPRILTVLKWFLTSIGVSGLFIATGFLIDTAYQDRLGYDVGRSKEILHLTVEAGHFFVDLVLISFTALADHPVITVAIVGLPLLALTQPGRRFQAKLRKIPLRVPGILLLWLLPLLLLLEMGLFDVPIMSLKGMLIHGLKPPDNLHRQILIRPLVEQVWQDEICSRVSKENVPNLRDLTIQCRFSRNWYRQRLKDRFALNLFLTCGLSGLAFGRIQRQRSRGLAAHRRESAMLLLAVLNLVLLPLSYGKSMRSTFAEEVVISHKPSEGAIHGVLLFRSSDALVIFEKKELQIWIVPEQEVGLVRIENEYDVIEFFVNKKLEFVPSSEPPPP